MPNKYPGKAGNVCNGCCQEIDKDGDCGRGWNHYTQKHDSEAVFMNGKQIGIERGKQRERAKEAYPGTIHNGTVCAQCKCKIDDNHSCPCGWDHYRKRKRIDLGQRHLDIDEKEPTITPIFIGGRPVGSDRFEQVDDYPGRDSLGYCNNCRQKPDAHYSECGCGWNHKLKKRVNNAEFTIVAGPIMPEKKE